MLSHPTATSVPREILPVLLKNVREAYDRYLKNPGSDPLLVSLAGEAQEDRNMRVKMVRDFAYRAIPFIIEPTALDLIATVQSHVKLAEDFGPLLLEAPLPFDSVWMEFEEELAGKRTASGILIQKIAGKILVCSLHRTAGESLLEPLLFLTVDGEGKLDIRADPYTSPRFLDRYDGNQDERVSQLFADVFPQTGWAILNAVRAMHLIKAKGGPLDADQEPMFSRPERRRMEREGTLSTSAPPTVTKIRVNAQGRLHLQAIDEEEGGDGGARRRAHRVRGHEMRTAKGMVWRKAHVRGFGPLNETIRVIEAEHSTLPAD